ncbi:hypothetical protein EX191_10500 [Vibrio chemaguriensis]|uniref:Uncharacterized protein n=1 Tax=Vibrio chemaguriensis TaxID=2527672 RepID=A0ABX1HWG0_9VIBR|nr:hypothetical protein [Vibrio chemaguriensis]NKJ68219.1 hypothetical protein [Vibrio chemaguriensis]
MIKELISSISGNVRERASSPLLGSYTIAAVIVNWKALVVLFTSERSGGQLVEEVSSVVPSLEISIGYPMAIALAISLGYPTLRAMVSTFNTYSRLLEIKAEYKLEDLKESLDLKRDPIENLIKHINEHDYYEKIGYHDLKRLVDYLPDEESLLIKRDKFNSNNQLE